MSIPKYDELLLPLLTFIGDGKDYSKEQVHKAMRKQFGLTESDVNMMLPSGTQSVFSNRIAWAKAYLKQAGLVESPKRGRTRITERGQKVLSENPPAIDREYLKRFPEFGAFLNRSRTAHKETEGNASDTQTQGETVLDVQTPEEAIESSFQALQENLAQELLDTLLKCSPGFFERVVVDLLVKMGYGGSLRDAGSAIGGSGDEGVDGIIKEDKLGLDVIYVQAKRWQGSVSRPEVQKFAGALLGKKAKKGIFITTSSFTQEAWDFVKHLDSKIGLVDGSQLARLMIEHNVGVSVEHTYELKRVDSDYFAED